MKVSTCSSNSTTLRIILLSFVEEKYSKPSHVTRVRVLRRDYPLNMPYSRFYPFLVPYSSHLSESAAVPIFMFVQALSQALVKRDQTGALSTIIDRAISTISTVKVYNAIPYENSRASINSFNNLKSAANKLNMVRVFTSGLAQFLIVMAMFVQGFWFGAKLVR